jgi:ribosomal protein S18 acetylase RimI-like enzyme
MNMEGYTLFEQLPSAEEYCNMRRIAGWGVHPVEAAARALPNSLYGVCVRRDSDGSLVGMARVVGDGTCVFYVQDVIVLPECQRQGIGKRMMDEIMGFIAKHACPQAVVGLMSALGKEPFYEKYGFMLRPNSKFGAGMTFFWPPKGREE